MGEKIREITAKLLTYLRELKVPKQQILASLFYLLILTVGHWKLKPDLGIIFFLAGGFFGIYFLDLSERIFRKGDKGEIGGQEGLEKKSPFKNVLFQAAFVLLALFVITSSGSLFGAGMVLSMYLGMLISQYRELMGTGNLNSWFWPVKTEMTVTHQKIYLGGLAGIFLLLNLLFI